MKVSNIFVGNCGISGTNQEWNEVEQRFQYYCIIQACSCFWASAHHELKEEPGLL